MTPAEFKSWFDGFTEGLAGLPNEAQWTRIKARVAEIDGRATSYPVYIDRYVRPWYPDVQPWQPWHARPYTICGSGTAVSGALIQNKSDVASYDARAAFYALGKTDATSVTQ